VKEVKDPLKMENRCFCHYSTTDCDKLYKPQRVSLQTN